MTRLLVALPTLTLLLTLAPAAPVPVHLMPKGEPFTFPAAVGTRWVYRQGADEFTISVTAVERSGTTATVRLGHDIGGGPVAPWGTVEVTPEGWFRTHSGAVAMDRPLCLLRLPSRPGRAWGMHFDVGKPREQKGTLTARGWGTVETAAGTFRAARMDAEYTFVGKTRRATFWYAPGVGEVRMEDDGVIGRELLSFTPAKP